MKRKFEVPTRENVSPANQGIFDNIKKNVGFIPNLLATFAYSENGLARYLAYQNAKTSFTNKEKEAINLIVSQVNGCVYCQSVHTAIGKMNGFTDEQLLEIRNGKYPDSKLNSLVRLAADITKNRGNTSDELVNDFFAQGYTNESLVDLVIQISDKTAMNYLHIITDIPVDFPIADKI